MAQRIFVDANILFSRTLRDWLFLLKLQSENSMFIVMATEDVLAETIYRLRRRYPDWDGGQISRIREALIKNLDELVEEFPIRDDYLGIDPNDVHVHSAAVAASAHILLTSDSGFLDLGDTADEFPYEIWSADEFFVLVDDSAPHLVERVTELQVRHWNKAPESAGRIVEKLVNSGCPEFADRVVRHLRSLSGVS